MVCTISLVYIYRSFKWLVGNSPKLETRRREPRIDMSWQHWVRWKTPTHRKSDYPLKSSCSLPAKCHLISGYVAAGSTPTASGTLLRYSAIFAGLGISVPPYFEVSSPVFTPWVYGCISCYFTFLGKSTTGNSTHPPTGLAAGFPF